MGCQKREEGQPEVGDILGLAKGRRGGGGQGEGENTSPRRYSYVARSFIELPGTKIGAIALRRMEPTLGRNKETKMPSAKDSTRYVAFEAPDAAREASRNLYTSVRSVSFSSASTMSLFSANLVPPSKSLEANSAWNSSMKIMDGASSRATRNARSMALSCVDRGPIYTSGVRPVDAQR